MLAMASPGRRVDPAPGINPHDMDVLMADLDAMMDADAQNDTQGPSHQPIPTQKHVWHGSIPNHLGLLPGSFGGIREDVTTAKLSHRASLPDFSHSPLQTARPKAGSTSPSATACIFSANTLVDAQQQAVRGPESSYRRRPSLVTALKDGPFDVEQAARARHARTASGTQKSILQQLLASRIGPLPQVGELKELAPHQAGDAVPGSGSGAMDMTGYGNAATYDGRLPEGFAYPAAGDGTNVYEPAPFSYDPSTGTMEMHKSQGLMSNQYPPVPSRQNGMHPRPALALETGIPSGYRSQNTAFTQESSPSGSIALQYSLGGFADPSPSLSTPDSVGLSQQPSVPMPVQPDAGRNRAYSAASSFATATTSASASTNGLFQHAPWQAEPLIQPASLENGGFGAPLNGTNPAWMPMGNDATQVYSPYSLSDPNHQPGIYGIADSQDKGANAIPSGNLGMYYPMPAPTTNRNQAWPDSDPATMTRPPLLQSTSGSSSVASGSSIPRLSTSKNSYSSSAATGPSYADMGYLPQPIFPAQNALHHDQIVRDMHRMTVSADVLTAHVRQYLEAENRYAMGERKIIVHSPRVGQKSYGTEKRFLCPPPMATLIGRPWWLSDATGKAAMPPVINIAISQEQVVQDVKAIWTTTLGRHIEDAMDVPFMPGEEPFVGRVAGRTLHISEQPDKKRIVNAQVKVSMPPSRMSGLYNNMAPSNHVVGVFESKEIKIISKPSKKRQSSKSSELCLQHGSTVSLFNRLRSQTSSTKFLAVSPNIGKLNGSDGKPLLHEEQLPAFFTGFVADAATWSSFAIWLVDPAKQPSGPPPPPVPENDVYAAPVDAVTVPPSEPVPVICYNQCIRLQCIDTGLLSPLFVIRRLEVANTVMGGDGTSKDQQLGKCPMGESAGDAVSQLHKVAFELYADPFGPVHGRDPGSPGQWLTCEGDSIRLRSGKSRRAWSSHPEPASTTARHARQLSSSLPATPSGQFTAVLPMTPRIGPGSGNPPHSPSAPVSPAGVMSPLSQSQSGEQSYFSLPRKHSGSSSGLGSGSGSITPWEEENGGGIGPVRRRRGSSSASQTAYKSPLSTTERQLHHDRKNSVASSYHSQNSTGLGITNNMAPPAITVPAPAAGQSEQYGNIAGAAPASHRMPSQQSTPVPSTHDRWTVDILETATWTIVGTEQRAYTFYVPQYVSNLSAPVTPFPTMSKFLPPGQAAETPAGRKYDHQFTTLHDIPLATFYGSGFSKTADGTSCNRIYYGATPAQHHEVRCSEVMCAEVPPTVTEEQPILLARADGQVLYPTPLKWR